jgi:ABC-type nitrate/sulfonate/bicarbonate transport system substrate-binding protein
MKRPSPAALGFLACMLWLSSGAQTQAQTPAKNQIHVLTLLGRPLQFVVADKQGIFANHGLEVVNDNKKNSEELRADLAAGKGDLAYLAVDNDVAMVELAHQDVVIVMGGEGSQNELVVQPTIKSFADLRGKTVIVDAVNTAYALQLIKILSLNGLKAGSDYELKAYGATPARLAAMRDNKDFSGSMLGPPTSLLAKHDGFGSLGSVPQLIGPYQAAGFFTQRAWAKAHRELLVSFLAACIEAQRWLMDPANKSQVVEILMSQYHLAPEIAAADYEMAVTQPGGFSKDAKLDMEGFQNVLKLRAEVEGQWNGHPPSPDKYYDASYYDAALAIAK